MKFYDWLWNWWNPLKPKMHSGKCELCDNQGIIWLNSQQILCWEHYVEAMKEKLD